MAIQQVEKWQTSDGKLFDDEIEASYHEKYIEIGQVFVEEESSIDNLSRFYKFVIELQKYFYITRRSEV